MKIRLIIVSLFVALVISSTASHAWLIYHKSDFKGKLIDTETKQPIVGAVVVASYQKTLVAGFGPMTSTFDIREAVTDKDGIFKIPSYTTLINPFCVSSFVSFVFYKPGYGKQVVPLGISPVDFELFLSEYFGVVRGIMLNKWSGKERNGPEQYYAEIPFGVVELPKLKTNEERLRAMPSPEGEVMGYKKQKTLIKLINEERRNLGLTGAYQIK